MSNLLSKIGEIIPVHGFVQKIVVMLFFLAIIMIPLFSYLIAQRNTQSQANNTPADRSFSNGPVTEPKEVPKGDALDALRQMSEQQATSKLPSSTEASTSADSASTSVGQPTTAVTFGPTLGFKLVIEGHPAKNQSLKKLFIGIAAGAPSATPTYLLSFTVDIPESGSFENLSLAGLDTGTSYTAYLKGPSQLATASAFIMNAGVTNLNGGNVINLLSGDLNEDNVVNSADYSIAKSVFGTTPSSTNWNERADINIDQVVNSLDLAIIVKNFGKTGLSGAWYSPTPPTSTSSGGLSGGVGGLSATPSASTPSGYWIWVPR